MDACAAACRAGGHLYFSLECPTASNVQCHCSSSLEGSTAVDPSRCRSLTHSLIDYRPVFGVPGDCPGNDVGASYTGATSPGMPLVLPRHRRLQLLHALADPERGQRQELLPQVRLRYEERPG